MRTWLNGGLILLLISVPLTVGYLTAPCDSFGTPVVLSVYRLRQERFLKTATRWAADVTDAGHALEALVQAPPPTSTGAAFRLAEQVGQAANRLDTLTPPEAPAEYSLLALTMQQARDTYVYAAEQLLVFYGTNDTETLLAAQEALRLAETSLADVAAGLAGLAYPRCREVWRE